MNTYIVDGQILRGVSLQSVLTDLGYDDIENISGYKGKYIVTLNNDDKHNITCFWLEKILKSL